MYNYYTELKKQKEAAELESKQKLDKKHQIKRKEQMGKMVVNYEKRIKNFVYEMASSPIKIKDYQNVISSSRKEFLDEENQKIIGAKGFVFKSFKTEKERVQEYLREKNTINNVFNVGHLQSPRENDKDLKYDITQPNMRFKPRTDLERIYDAVNSYSYGRVEREVVDRQLMKLDLNVSRHRDDEIEFEEIPDYTISNYKKKKIKTESEKKQEVRQKILHDRREIKNKMHRKFVDNSDARQLMADLHHKTHFKGASGFTLFHNTTLVPPPEMMRTSQNVSSQIGNYNNYTSRKNTFANNGHMNTTSSNYRSRQNTSTSLYNVSNVRLHTQQNEPVDFLSTQMTQGEQSESSHNIKKNNKSSSNILFHTNSNNLNNPNNSQPNKTQAKFSYNKKIFHDNEVSNDIAQTNPLLYNLNFNPFKKTQNLDSEENGSDKMKYLKRLAFNDDLPVLLPNSPKKKNGKTVQFLAKLAKSNKHIKTISKAMGSGAKNYSTTNFTSTSYHKNEDEIDSLMKHNPLTFFQKFAESPDDIREMKKNCKYKAS
jgi:hypothetical protein